MAVCTRVKSFFGLSETRRWQILFVSCFSAFFSSLHLFSCLNATGKWSFSKLFSSCATVISLLIDFHISSIVLLFSSLYFFTLSFPLFCFFTLAKWLISEFFFPLHFCFISCFRSLSTLWVCISVISHHPNAPRRYRYIYLYHPSTFRLLSSHLFLKVVAYLVSLPALGKVSSRQIDWRKYFIWILPSFQK